MATNLLPKPDVLFTESPVSWNTRYVTPEGFECQLTLRGESGQEVLEKANAAITYLLSNGCTPSMRSFSNQSKPASNGASSKSQEYDTTDTPTNGNNGHHEINWCPIHQVQMKRWEKNGRTWYSHKAGDEWCTGKPKRK